MKRIRIENFRCYADTEINFKRGVNLFVGDNASGKTSVLKACRYVLSSFFAGFSDDNTVMLSPGDKDFSIRVHDGEILPEMPINISFTCYSSLYPTIENGRGESINPGVDSGEYYIQKKSKKNSRALVTGFATYRNYTRTLLETYMQKGGDVPQRKYELPLFASFTTEDIHATRKIKEDRFKQYMHKPSFGYYECLEGDGFFPYWIKRLLVLQEGNKGSHEIEIVRRAIINALGKKGCGIIMNMVIRHNQGKVYYVLTDGREVEAELLSDGYKRLVNIVTDIAFRCALLNYGKYGLSAAEETKGTVLIDEIDLHLHPSLQATILGGLHHAFPQLQIIATTHAPMVMTGVQNDENNVVYKLGYTSNEGYTITETHTYGLDCSTITENVLGRTPRDSGVSKQLEELFDLIDSDNDDDARVRLQELKNKFGSNLPELARAEAMLNFLIEPDNEENK